MRSRLLGILGVLPLLTALVSACGESEGDRLAAALAQSMPVELYAPKIDGKAPTRWSLHADGSVTLSYGAASGFAPALTIREADPGNLCAGRQPDWDDCDQLDGDAVLLGFEEMNALAVRRADTELFLSNFTLEVPDENFDTTEALVAWRSKYVAGLVTAVRDAPVLTVDEFVDMVPDGKIENAA